MTDDFNSRYRLLKVVALDQGIRSHNAQELTTGRVVMVHLVDDAGPERVRELLEMIARLPDADRSRVLETATLTAGFAIVTEFLSPMRSFAAWLSSRAPDVTQTMDYPVLPVTPATLEDVPSLQITDRVTPPKPVSRVVQAPAAPTPPPSAAADAALPEPGEFTRLFRAGGVASATPIAPTEPSTPTPPPEERLAPPLAAMETPVLPPLVLPPPITPAPVMPTPVVAPTPPPVRPAAPPPPPASAPGEFTQMFSPAARQASAPPPPPARSAPPPPVPVITPPAMAAPTHPASTPQFHPTPTPAPPVSATPPKAPPGAFTQMFSGPASQSNAPPPTPATPLLDPFRVPTNAPPNSASPSVPFGSASGSMYPSQPSGGNVFGSQPPAQHLPPAPAAPSRPSHFPPPPAASQSPLDFQSAPPPLAPPPLAAPLSSSGPPVLQPPVFDDKLSQLGSLDPSRRAAAPPSEYTQMIRGAAPVAAKGASSNAAPSTAAGAAKSAGPAQPAAPAARKFPAMLLVIINAVLFVLMATILWVVFGRKPTTPTVTPPAVTAPAIPNPPLKASPPG